MLTLLGIFVSSRFERYGKAYRFSQCLYNVLFGNRDKGELLLAGVVNQAKAIKLSIFKICTMNGTAEIYKRIETELCLIQRLFVVVLFIDS